MEQSHQTGLSDTDFRNSYWKNQRILAYMEDQTRQKHTTNLPDDKNGSYNYTLGHNSETLLGGWDTFK